MAGKGFASKSASDCHSAATSSSSWIVISVVCGLRGPSQADQGNALPAAAAGKGCIRGIQRHHRLNQGVSQQHASPPKASRIAHSRATTTNRSLLSKSAVWACRKAITLRNCAFTPVSSRTWCSAEGHIGIHNMLLQQSNRILVQLKSHNTPNREVAQIRVTA